MEKSSLVIRHMKKARIDPANLQAEANALFFEAMDANTTSQEGTNFNSLVFDRPCYLSIGIGISDWTLYYPEPGNVQPIKDEIHDPLTFVRKTKSGANDKDENYSFYNAQPFVFQRPSGGPTFNGFTCTNYFTDKTGDPIARDYYYGFEIYMQIPFALLMSYLEVGYLLSSAYDKPTLRELAFTGSDMITIIIDPDGQNQGPH
jgi:hypothetical protein